MGTLEFLGTGTSTGVPMIGCRCSVCSSKDPHNNRLRASALVKIKGKVILIDTGPEFRLQALRANLTGVDGVLLTHTHADHVAGFDDLRAFNFVNGERVKVFGSPETVEIIKHNYSYIFGEAIQVGGGLPKIDLIASRDTFYIDDIKVTPIPIWHGKVLVYGYRIGQMAYVTDFNRLEGKSLELLKGLDLLVLGALRYRPHATHLNIDQAISLVESLQPQRAYFTHLSHDIEHERVTRRLQNNIFLAYDGLKLSFQD